jgi:ferredoxin-NADP reductase
MPEHHMTTRSLKVITIVDETPLIRRFVLAADDGAPLRSFSAGAHIPINIPGVGVRKYSLVNPLALSGGTQTPRAYILGIRRDDQGEGGSRYMHALKVGDTVDVDEPANNFALEAGEAPVLLLGGGIGITPLITMAAELRCINRPFQIVYAARARGEMAFLPEIEALAGNGLQLHCDDIAGGVFDINATFAGLPADVTVYACGPKPMLKTAVQASRKLKWPANRLKFELFYSVATTGTVTVQAQSPSPTAAANSKAVVGSGEAGVARGASIDQNKVTSTPNVFEVELKSSGRTFVIPAEKSVLDVLLDAGTDVMHDCKKGECGVCQTGVISGEIDHRDSVLGANEKMTNKVMQICVSRAKSSKLVLDL